MQLLDLNQDLTKWREDLLAKGCGEDYVSYALMKAITSFLSENDIKLFSEKLKGV